MSALNWLSPRECHIRDRRIVVENTEYAKLRTDAERIVLLKDKRFFDHYEELLKEQPPSYVLELGIFEGGSSMILAEMWPEAHIIGIDLRAKNDAVTEHLKGLGMEERVATHYGVSQEDRTAVQRILDNSIGANRLDLVIDDASHLYYPSRKSFDIVFPYVAAGGWYVIEDWGWAHWRDWQDSAQWTEEPALSNLIFELVMANASTPSVIAQLRINQHFAAVQRGGGTVEIGSSLLENLYVCRKHPLTLL